MANFLENILNSDICNQVLERAKEKLGETKVGTVLEQLGVEDLDLGQVAKSVISVIGVAKNSAEDAEDEEIDDCLEEEVEEEELDETDEELEEEEECDEEEEEYDDEEEADEADEDDEEEPSAQDSGNSQIVKTAINILKKVLKK